MYIAQSSNQSPLWVRGHFLPYPFTWYLGESSYTYTYTYNTLASVLLSRFLVSERADSLLPLAPKRFFFSKRNGKQKTWIFHTLLLFFLSAPSLSVSLSQSLSLFLCFLGFIFSSLSLPLSLDFSCFSFSFCHQGPRQILRRSKARLSFFFRRMTQF